MSSEDARFIEVRQITITGSHPKRWGFGGDYRVLIQHEHGTEETIRSSGSGAEIIISCKTFIQLNVKSTIHIHRTKGIDRDGNPSGVLNLTGQEMEDCTINLNGSPELAVTLKLGEKMTMAQVAEARVRDANEVLEKQSKNVEELERVTGHVKMLVGALEVAAKLDPFPYAEGAVSIAKMALEGMDRIPTEHKALKQVALDCIEQIKLDKSAQAVFKSDIVKEPLNTAMKSVIKALEFISHYYSQSRISRIAKPKGSAIEDLTSELRKQKEQIRDAFILALGEGQHQIMDQMLRLKPSEVEQPVPKVSQEKEGWVFVDNPTEPDLLKQFLGTVGGVAKGKDPCLPGTRVSILQKLTLWAQDDSPEASRLFWLYGVAGCGKSAVAMSACKELNKVDRLAGSFFCRRDEIGRRNPVQLFGHLSACLAEQSPGFKDTLIRSLEKYRRLDSMDKFTFIEYALKDPLAEVEDRLPVSPVIFVIDALDECNDSGTVAGFLAEIITIAPWMKLIVTSREQPDIENSFIDSSIPNEMYDLFADDAQSDIHKYLLKRLHPFPDLFGYVDMLSDMAGGLFIWLHTVTEVIINSRSGRKKMIQAFIEQPLSGDAEKRMAETYLTVLEQASGSSSMVKAIVRKITGLLLASSSNAPLTISGLYAFLPPDLAETLSPNEFGDLVLALKPVLKLTPIDDSSEEMTAPQYRFSVQAHHASFLDFCSKRDILIQSDRRAETEMPRPNPFWTNPITLHQDMALGCLEIMKKGKRFGDPNESPLGLRFNVCGLETSYKLNNEVNDLQERVATRISPHLLYSSLYWPSHVFNAIHNGYSSEVSVEGRGLQEALADLLETTRSLYWLEVLSLTGNLSAGVRALVDIAKRTEVTALKRFTQIAYEIHRFVDQCLPAIATSTPHLYFSLTWISVESLLWTAWKTEFSGASILKTPVQQPSQLMSSTVFPVRVDIFAVSPDEKHVASGSSDGYIRLWNLRSTNSPVRERQISKDASPIDALAYALDGAHIFCACNGFMYELESETLHPAGEAIAISYTNIRCMAMSEAHIAFGKEDGRVVIIDAKTSREFWSEHVQTRAVDAIDFTPDGSHLVYAAYYTYVCVWHKARRSYRHADSPLGESKGVTAIAFSRDGKIIATGEDGKVRLFDAESGESIGGFDAKLLVQFLTFSYGNRVICAFASKQGFVRCSEDFPPSSEGSRHYVIDDYHVWAEETSVQIWDVDISRRQKTQSVGQTKHVISVAFSPDGRKFVSESIDCSVRMWDTQTGEQEKLAVMKHSNWIRFVTCSPDGKSISSGGDDNVVRVWNAQTGKPVRVLEGHSDWVNCGAYSPDGMSFVSGSNDATLRTWDLEVKDRQGLHRRIFHSSLRKSVSNHKNSVLSGHSGGVRSVAFSPDGSCIASASEDSTIRFWDAKTWKTLGHPLVGHDDYVCCIAFSPKGNHIMSSGRDHTVRIWDVQTRRAIGEPLRGHTSDIYSVAFSPNGNLIFSASWDGTIRCWDTVTGNPVGHPLKDDSIYSLAISPDGQRIVSGTYNGDIRLWDCQAFKWELDESFISCGHRCPERVPYQIPDDGWIRTPEGALLLWVPAEHRVAVCRLNIFSISNDETEEPNRIMWDKLHHGERWMDIRGDQ